MTCRFACRGVALAISAGILVAPCVAPGADDLETLRRELERMKQQMRALQDAMQRQESTIRALEAQRGGPPAATGPKAPAEAAALDAALEAARAAAPPPPQPSAPPAVTPPALYARPLGGRTTLRLIDVSTDILVAAGGSTADDDTIALLQGGAHDPKRRGFTLQQAEFSFAGAVDPYFTGEAHVVLTDASIELEEAFLTTQRLPYGLQLELGHFLTEFGRLNPTHPHAWDWIDQPVIVTRLLGGDGLRNPGLRVGWLTPLPWFSHVDVGLQNAGGETAPSFLGEAAGGGHAHGHDHGHGGEEEDGGIGGRPAVYGDVRNLGDLLYLARWSHGFALGDDLTGVLGGSALYGPNSSGPDGRTWIFGGDLILKWRPADNFRGWPFLTWQSEFMQRNYKAAAVHDEADLLDLPAAMLRDWGFYTQLLYGFRYGWAAGLRYEYASGSGESVGGREADPMRSTRHRVAPLLSWRPTEYSRIRLQYNLDRPEFLDNDWQSSVWVAFEVLYGEHPAHRY